jgi:hypothetical protein
MGGLVLSLLLRLSGPVPDHLKAARPKRKGVIAVPIAR